MYMWITVLPATLILIGLYIAADILFSAEMFLPKNISFGVFGFFGMFLILSGILFAFDVYNLWLAYALCGAVGIAAAGFGVFALQKPKGHRGGTKKQKKYKQAFQEPTPAAVVQTIKANVKKTGLGCQHLSLLPLAGLLVLGIIVSFSKFEYYGMGQDQGMYQTAAIYRMAGHNSIRVEPRAYDILEDERDKWLFTDALYQMSSISSLRGNLVGFYVDNERMGSIAGYMHGVPGFSALLSISGFIFGLSGMWHINTLFFLSSICLLFVTLRHNLGLKLSVSIVVTTVFILSPIIIWTAKSSLTECFTTLIITALLFLITSGEKYANKLLWLPVAVFAFFHVSIYTMMPMFCLLFIIMYMQSRAGGSGCHGSSGKGNGHTDKYDRTIAISGFASLAAYICGFFMMMQTNKSYTQQTYRQLWSMVSFLDLRSSDFTAFVFWAVLLAAAVMGMLFYCVKRFDIKLNLRVFEDICKFTVAACIAYICYRWANLFMDGRQGFSSFRFGDMLESYADVTLIAYALLSGFIVLPLVICCIFAKKDIFSKSRLIVPAVMFIYCIMIYSAFLRIQIQYYYYFARYLAPFIPVILILGAVCIDGIGAKARAVISCACIIATVPFAFFVTAHKDHSRMDWDAFEQAISAVESLDESDTVVVSNESISFFYLPLNALTDSVILPDEDFAYVRDRMENPGIGRVFHLSMREEAQKENSQIFPAQWSGYIRERSPLLPLPMDAEQGRFYVFLTEITNAEN